MIAQNRINQRDNFITVVTGAQKTGKTVRTKQEMRIYTSTDNRIGRKPKPALIFDVNDEFREFRTVKYDVSDPNDKGKYIGLLLRPEIRRINPQKPDGSWMDLSEKKKAFLDICQNFRNGCVLFEDLNAYITETKNEEVTSTLINVRHRGIDVFMHVQSLSAVTTRMFQNARMIRMHYQIDELDRYRQRISNFEMVRIAKYIVDTQFHDAGNRYFFVYIDQYDLKIDGCDIEQYKAAVRKYAAAYGLSDTLQKNIFFYLRIK